MAIPPDGMRIRQAFSRRDALGGMLRLGGGLVAAGLTACGPSNSQTAAAREALRAGAPSVPARPAATATPTVPELALTILPRTLSIPSVGIEVPVESARTIRNVFGRQEIVVPNYGVVSPYMNLGRNSVNNIWILGHSRWAGERQPMYRISEVRKDDLISIAGFERTRRQDMPQIDFVAERLVIADIDAATEEIYRPRRAVPRLVLQTSARVTGERLWILDRPAVEARAENVVKGNIDDPALYLVLLVFATLTPESLAYLRRPPPDESAIT